MKSSRVFCASFFALAAAQFPATPTDLTTVRSKVDNDITISYKKVWHTKTEASAENDGQLLTIQASICETRPDARVYSGFVHIPANKTAELGGIDFNTYFLYFQSRQDPETAPLAIYLAGGPGEASTYAAFSSESGPCYVNVFGNDTIDNIWSFSNTANLLYVDQPLQAGFSYSDLVVATREISEDYIEEIAFDASNPPVTNETMGWGVFPDQSTSKTVKTTVSSGKAMWAFTEHWLSSFPEFSGNGKISIWGNSYGGFWVPETAVQLHHGLSNLVDDHPLRDWDLTVDAIGTTNGCIDLEQAMLGYPEYARNNTYGVEFITEELYVESVEGITETGGCLDQMRICREEGKIGDPQVTGANATVNAICQDALLVCEVLLNVLNDYNNVSAFDVAISSPDACPYYLPTVEYLNQANSLYELGVPLNWSMQSYTSEDVFGFATTSMYNGTGDAARQSGVDNLSYLLSHGVRVSLFFGDRDYRCPWTGGEATAKATPWLGQDSFLEAGFQEVEGMSSDANGAVVRQAGLLTFGRIFDSGHAASAYAPETVFTLFNRTLAGVDIATGTQSVDDDYRTTGPTDSLSWRNTMPEGWPVRDTCVVAGGFLPESPWDIAGIDTA